ncbi:OmpA family protein [Haloferula sp. A504]|uniref:OmpA family protein n=1 Tax=Haloferula sp. A504 TaxID=3373601 RepID=UPI0031BFDFC8|nr:OmpA family protein [Verrucomicrobiaceae bacterium E54]
MHAISRSLGLLHAGLFVATSSLAAAGDTPTDPPRTDLLNWAEGAFVVRTPEPPRSEAHVIALDGDPATRPIGVPRHAPLPHQFIVELPATTTFDTFEVPVLGEFGPAKGKHVKTVEIEGSSESAEAGFAPLAKLIIEIEKEEPQTFPVSEPRPVRWLRVRFVDRYTPQANDADSVLFSELRGYGTQEARTVEENAFTGVWNLRRGHDVSQNLIELRQKGDQIEGCQVVGGQDGTIRGTVVDGVARLVTTTTQGARKVSTPSIALITIEGEIHGVQSLHAGLRPFSGVPSEDSITTPCSKTPEPMNPVTEALEAGLPAILYGIRFDVDSDVLRPDATPALEQILEALETTPYLAIVIEGHTDSDGGDDHNLDLSQRRAQAVVNWLTEKGIAGERLTPKGKGEAEPIASNDSATGKAMNRRVEVEKHSG